MNLVDKYLLDSPREKLEYKGVKYLSDSELLSLILISGTQEITVDLISKNLLHLNKNSLKRLFRLSLSQLLSYKGIGHAKACSLLAAFELARRKDQEPLGTLVSINSSKNAYEYVKSDYIDLQQEEFRVLLLNRNNTIIKNILISKGGVAGTVVDPKIVYKHALEELASSIILVHNHPSGNMRPSDADNAITKKLVKAGEYFDIKVLDHLIVCDSVYYSYADEGKI